MLEKGKTLIEIDLNQFKLHIRNENSTELSLHFDSPSRKFYLSVIALVTNEMKKLGKITSIPLGDHYESLVLLNETIGNRAGSSARKKLLRRIYRKWKEALPDLERAPLFTIPGRRKEYGGVAGKTYPFTDEEKDIWANLFEYKGSHENVRLRFSVDRLGATLDQVFITYGKEPDLSHENPWHRFMGDLKREAHDHDLKDNVIIAATPGKRARWHRWSLGGLVGLLIVGVIAAAWYFSFHKPQSASDISPFLESPLPLPDKPSVAVLPFCNVSGDPEQEYFSDGLTEEIITALAMVPDLFVIARNSVFTYKGKPVRAKQVGQELGVRYVLEGSVRKAGIRVRITAQLVDTDTGHHLWAGKYDRDLKDIFELQDEITGKILLALRVKLTEGEQILAYRKGTRNHKAYEKALQALWSLNLLTREGNLEARRFYQEAIALDTSYTVAIVGSSYTHWLDVVNGWSRSPSKSMEQALRLAKKALAIDNSLADTHVLMSNIFLMKRQFKRAMAAAEMAISLNPNGANVNACLGLTLRYLGRVEEAIEVLEKAMRRNPIPPTWYLHNLGDAYRLFGMYEKAVELFKRLLNKDQDYFLAWMYLATTYSQMGREEEAREAAREVLRLYPEFKVDRYIRRLPYKDQNCIKVIVNALRKADLT